MLWSSIIRNSDNSLSTIWISYLNEEILKSNIHCFSFIHSDQLAPGIPEMIEMRNKYNEVSCPKNKLFDEVRIEKYKCYERS